MNTVFCSFIRHLNEFSYKLFRRFSIKSVVRLEIVRCISVASIVSVPLVTSTAVKGLTCSGSVVV